MGTFFAAMPPVGSGITMGEHFAHVALGMMVFRVLMSTIIGSASIFIGNQAFILDGHVRLTDYLLKDRKSTRLNSSHYCASHMLSSAVKTQYSIQQSTN